MKIVTKLIKERFYEKFKGIIDVQKKVVFRRFKHYRLQKYSPNYVLTLL